MEIQTVIFKEFFSFINLPLQLESEKIKVKEYQKLRKYLEILRIFLSMKKKKKKYYKQIRENDFWSNNYIKHKSNGEQNRILSVEAYLHKISPYFRDIINDLKQSDTWKIQLTITINSFLLKMIMINV